MPGNSQYQKIEIAPATVRQLKLSGPTWVAGYRRYRRLEMNCGAKLAQPACNALIVKLTQRRPRNKQIRRFLMSQKPIDKYLSSSRQ